jgi:D-lyxose ketol-isomerase
MNLRSLIFIASAIVLLAECAPKAETKSSPKAVMMPFTKKYTNADYYKDGKIQPEIVKKAYLEMLENYGVPYSATLKAGIWMTDFSLGDFEHVGMAGIFWVNDSVHGYFGHEIYLLPGQMIPEHFHVASSFPAKYESWRVTHGSCYNFGIGEPTPNPPLLPVSQKEYITSLNFVRQEVDEVVSLKKVESPHFLFAGDNGAIVAEYATYHDGAGLRFTNPKIIFNNILAQN